MLDKQEKIPAFKCNNTKNETISSTDLIGKKTVLYFYPKDDTPGCTREAIAFSEQIDAFTALNVRVIGVSKDSVASHCSFTEKYNLKIDLISDEEGRLCEAFGTWVEKKNYGRTYMGIQRATFIIDEKGVVEKVWKAVKVDGHIEQVLKYLNEA